MLDDERTPQSVHVALLTTKEISFPLYLHNVSARRQSGHDPIIRKYPGKAREPTFRTSLSDLSHFCVPLEVLYNLLTIRGD